MASVVTIMGRITRDIELRYTPNGIAVTELSVVDNRKMGDKEESTFVEVKVWGKQAEFAAKYLKKGEGVFVSGRLTQENWDDKATGAKRSKLVVTAENIEFVPNSSAGVKEDAAPQQSTPGKNVFEKANQQSRQTRQTRQVTAPKPAQREELPPMGGDDDEDVPF